MRLGTWLFCDVGNEIEFSVRITGALRLFGLREGETREAIYGSFKREGDAIVYSAWLPCSAADWRKEYGSIGRLLSDVNSELLDDLHHVLGRAVAMTGTQRIRWWVMNPETLRYDDVVRELRRERAAGAEQQRTAVEKHQAPGGTGAWRLTTV